jgi:hypothetical protein
MSKTVLKPEKINFFRKNSQYSPCTNVPHLAF